MTPPSEPNRQEIKGVAGYLSRDMAELQAKLKSAEAERDELLDALQKFKSGWDKFTKRQRDLLVHGQTLETASKNWDAFPEAFSFDFQPLFDLLAKIGRRISSAPTE